MVSKAGLFYTKKLLAFFASEELWQKAFSSSLVHGPREHILIVATDQPIQSSTIKLLPCWLYIYIFSISFPEKRAMRGPGWRDQRHVIPIRCSISSSSAPSNWHLISRNPHFETDLCHTQ